MTLHCTILCPSEDPCHCRRVNAAREGQPTAYRETPLDDYNRREVQRQREQDPSYHTSACLSASVDAFCDDTPDPGCTCGGDAKIAALNAKELSI